MTFAQLGQLTPHFDWARYFDAAKLPRADLNVDQPKLMAEIDRQLAETPLDDWKIYLSWNVLASAAPSLSAPFVDEDFAFNEQFLNGTQSQRPRWKRCVDAIDTQLGEALGKKYVEKHFPPAAKARMQELVANLRLAMRQTIESLTWMTEATKKRALEKLTTLNPKIGYPDRWKEYAGVKVTRVSLWDDEASARRWNVVDERAQIDKPVDRGRWGMTPPTSNAYYNPLLNEVVFPAGVLQAPAFDLEASDAVNYGAIGVAIGHEISHGFDDQGAQFDAEGRLSNWWTDADLAHFKERTQCVVDQFDGYFIEPGIHHNGKLVLGEAIGDLGGVKIAYLAFQLAQRGPDPTPTIDGFTPDQQFFISWGQFRGDAIRPEAQRMMLQADPHPISKFRVNGTLSNFTPFRQAFSCPGNAPMVRPAKTRCEVW